MRSEKLQNKNADIKEIGRVVSYFSGVASVKGLPNVFLHETLLDYSGNRVGLVVGFNKEMVEVIFFDDDADTDKPLFRSREIFSIPVSDRFLGRIVNGLGEPIDGKMEIKGEMTPVFVEAPSIIERDPVSDILGTGIKVIDTALPLGRGQRELIIGDRKLGKSTIASDVVLNQKNSIPKVYCIYVLCGKKESQLKELISLLKKNDAFKHVAVVAATARDSFASQYLAPFVGCAVGEYFRDRKKDALVIYDDLSNHAKVYRDISLLLKRVPSREAYPGDIFSLHAELLERSAKLSKKNGGGSLSALPIIETQEGDITSFIPTNLISITDGQIYLDRGLYKRRFIPAVNVGLSVSRVGSQVQPSSLKSVTNGIRIALSQYKEFQKLTQLETTISKEAANKIHRGELILELLKQDKHINVTWEEQVILFYSVEAGFFDDVEKDQWPRFEQLLLKIIKSKHKDILENIRYGKFEEEKKNVDDIVSNIKNEFFSEL